MSIALHQIVKDLQQRVDALEARLNRVEAADVPASVAVRREKLTLPKRD